jgi:hypothetical protein
MHHFAFPGRHQAPLGLGPLPPSQSRPVLDAPKQRKTHLFPVGEPPSACVALPPSLSVEVDLLERRRIRGPHFQLGVRPTDCAPMHRWGLRCRSEQLELSEPSTTRRPSELILQNVKVSATPGQSFEITCALPRGRCTAGASYCRCWRQRTEEVRASRDQRYVDGGVHTCALHFQERVGPGGACAA